MNLLQTIVNDNPGNTNEQNENLYLRSQKFANNAAQTTFSTLGKKVSDNLTDTVIKSKAFMNSRVKIISPEGVLSTDMSAKEAISELNLSQEDIDNLVISGVENSGEGRGNLALRAVTTNGTLLIEDMLPVQATDAFKPSFELGRINFTEDLESRVVDINQGIPGQDRLWAKSIKEIEFNPSAGVYETKLK